MYLINVDLAASFSGRMNVRVRAGQSATRVFFNGGVFLGFMGFVIQYGSWRNCFRFIKHSIENKHS